MKSLTATGTGNPAGVTAVKRSITNERDAIVMLEDHFKVAVQPSEIWLHSSGVLRALPDGLVGAREVVEVKCPSLPGTDFYKKKKKKKKIGGHVIGI